MWVDFDSLKDVYFGHGTDFDGESETSEARLKAKKLAYRYCIFGHTQSGGTTSGRAEVGGNDLMVTLGGWNGGTGGTSEQKAGTFMHELGHNLGLRHGGGDSRNYKPNYLSVMNYFFQFGLVRRSLQGTPPVSQLYKKFDFSRKALPTIY